ncbi:fimbria/pilus outer membrane usher protein [Lelliottia sp. SL45]|uniref:fimbria/pilus outer membrane usher protein n=1 Tax=Lelliottia sp. SL45 TaxID=2994665 RepID=UPI002274D64D|nr:fimbria/pilus outer membrane usher protein [Lelliottia sp. SL45]MCY1700982.1 fimbria/pilus outer membrane usher protein [Lelliottia sp. SL45]
MKFTLISITASVACIPGYCYADKYVFDESLLGENSKGIDMSLLNEGSQLPGTYTVDIVLNGDVVETRDVAFISEKTENAKVASLQPCLSRDDLERYGVKVEDYTFSENESECNAIASIPMASAHFEFNNLQLLINIPQASMRTAMSGLAPEQMWDDGIPVFQLNYRVNTSKTLKNSGGTAGEVNTYGQFEPGVNFGAWRLRNQTSGQNTDQSKKWQNVYTYAERNLRKIKSRLTLGDRYTPGNIFESIPFRGTMLASDENMVPYNQRAFSPVVRGIARTQATIEVSQNGYVIYNASIAPGPFELSDLSLPGSSNGNLDITVREADGKNQVFTIPYQTPAISVRKGYTEYSIMAGRYRPADSDIRMAKIAHATLIYGLPLNMTLYTGLQIAEHYRAGAIGLGESLGKLGAVSIDALLGQGEMQGKNTEGGTAWRLRYSKSVESTNTSFTATATRFTSRNYHSLSEVLDSWRNSPSQGNGIQDNSSDARKSVTSLQLSQPLGHLGFLSLNASRTNYLSRSGQDNSLGLTYSFSVFGASLSLGLSQARRVDREGKNTKDRQASLSLSVPFEEVFGSQVTATYQATSPSDQGISHEAGLNGYGHDNQLYWDIRERYQEGQSDSKSSALQVSWSGKFGQAGGSYSYSPSMSQAGAQISGGMLLHRNGLTFSQTLGDTVALIEAPGAAGVAVNGSSGVKTDSRGYTTVSYLTPYQVNTVSLNPGDLSESVELPQTDFRVVPTQGAVVSAKFMPRVGHKALMTLKYKGYEVVPFGAIVNVAEHQSAAGIVGDKGQVYMTGLPDEGKLVVKWKNGTCTSLYSLADIPKEAGMYKLNVQCD